MTLDLYVPANQTAHRNLMSEIARKWLNMPEFDRGEVHAQKLTTPEMITREITDVQFEFEIPPAVDGESEYWGVITQANLPWAEDHFRERVSGMPLNPPPAEAWWPYAQQGNSAHKDGEKFSHTYPERFWPKFAGVGDKIEAGTQTDGRREVAVPHVGIRFEYGDLEDLIEVLKKNPRSRQAYLPVWFPEDLAAARAGKRVPCTLGYHFMMHADGMLHATYFMRSCDIVRFFRDDVYMAGRLLQWVADSIEVRPASLRLHVSSLHAFAGDETWIRGQVVSTSVSASTRANYNFGGLL